jgi:hypothetical protein
MRPVNWDSGVRWGDPNLRWGSPSYLLEPGDPGYMADPTSASFPVQKPLTKRKQMPKADCIKRGDRAFSNQLLHFGATIGGYAALFGITPAQITAHQADANRFKWELDRAEDCSMCLQQWNGWKTITRKGGAFPATGAPVEMSWPTEPPAVAPGIEARFRALVQDIKNHPNYNPSIGEALGIEGEEKAGPDDSLTPDLTLMQVADGVKIGWNFQGFGDFLKALEIRVKRGDGPEELLMVDTNPNYKDSHPFPATPQKWTYRAVFLNRDGRIGQWCAPVSITVGG